MKTHEEIVTEELKKLDRQNKEKAESKGAASESSSETKKTEGNEESKRAQVEQAKQDGKLLATPDDKLSEPEVTRKRELESQHKSIEKSNTQKRIDQLTGQLKDTKRDLESTQAKSKEERDKLVADAAKMAKELDDLKRQVTQPQTEREFEKRANEAEEQRITKYLEEDKNKPRELRREMPKEEFDEWFAEDPEQATRCVTRQEHRRITERDKFVQQEKEKTEVQKFIQAQEESKKKLLEKFPGVVPDPERVKELKSQGKTDDQIRDTIMAENDQFRTLNEIVESDREKYLFRPDGPELCMKEMEKRLGSKDSKDSKEEELSEDWLAKIQKERDDAAEAERQRLARVDEGLASERGKETEEKSEDRIKLEEAARKAGISVEELDKAIERRNKIPGAGYTSGVKLKK